MPRKKTFPVADHVRALRAIFPDLSREANSDTIYAQLRAIEERAHRLAERECNGEVSEATSQRAEREMLDQLDLILGWRAANVPVFLNGDPRGYALKIHDRYMREHRDAGLQTDWGGYGILAPEGI